MSLRFDFESEGTGVDGVASESEADVPVSAPPDPEEPVGSSPSLAPSTEPGISSNGQPAAAAAAEVSGSDLDPDTDDEMYPVMLAEAVKAGVITQDEAQHRYELYQRRSQGV